MKKILLFAIVACFLSNCDKKEKEEEQQEILKISPPSWIHGTWLLKNNPSDKKACLKFTQDDFCVVADGITFCYKLVLVMGEVKILSQKSSSTTYEITIKDEVSTNALKFKKKSATEIQKVDPDGYSIWVKQ